MESEEKIDATSADVCERPKLAKNGIPVILACFVCALLIFVRAGLLKNQEPENLEKYCGTHLIYIPRLKPYYI